jgi:hypothetical protein
MGELASCNLWLVLKEKLSKSSYISRYHPEMVSNFKAKTVSQILHRCTVWTWCPILQGCKVWGIPEGLGIRWNINTFPLLLEINGIMMNLDWNISHKKQEISILTIKKQSKVNSSSTSHKESQGRKDKTENKGTKKKTKIKYESNMNNSAANLTPIQGPYRSHICSGTINSSIYDKDFSITTSPLTSWTPYSE